MEHQTQTLEYCFMQSRNEYPFSPDFNIGTTNIINNFNPTPAASSPPPSDNFLLLDGTNFLLFDGTDLLLL